MKCLAALPCQDVTAAVKFIAIPRLDILTSLLYITWLGRGLAYDMPYFEPAE